MTSSSNETKQQKKIDVVVAAFDEEENLPELFTQLRNVFDSEANYSWRCITVDNGSRDGSWSLITQQTQLYSRFIGLSLSRNFKMDGALTAGLEYCDGDAAIFMAADLQDPPSLIPKLVKMWEQGYDNVYAEVSKRSGVSLMRRINSRLFYLLMRLMTGSRIPFNVSDFRLMSKPVYEALRDLDERNRFMRGLVAWVGFSSIGVPVDRPPRVAGKSKAYSLEMLGFATRAILANSQTPLHVVALFGIALAPLSFVAFLGLFLLWVTRGVPFAGFGSLVSLGLLSVSLLSVMLGVIAEYLGLIYEEVKGRPNFIVREKTGNL
jgi:dolichol-phosphate mannosyltransferase